jgi:hypothetical protein
MEMGSERRECFVGTENEKEGLWGQTRDRTRLRGALRLFGVRRANAIRPA